MGFRSGDIEGHHIDIIQLQKLSSYISSIRLSAVQLERHTLVSQQKRNNHGLENSVDIPLCCYPIATTITNTEFDKCHLVFVGNSDTNMITGSPVDYIE